MFGLKKRLKTGLWHVAYRRKPQGTLLTDTRTPFHVIPNSLILNVMDPFVFEYQGKTYIFAETYDAFRSRGTIGYCRWDGKKFSKWKQIIIEPYHLSYPFVLCKDGQIYIIPESFLNGDVHAYRAVNFPDKWERTETLVDDVKFVDTTFFESDDFHYAFTYNIAPHKKQLLLFKLSSLKLSECECKLITTDDSCARPGGRVFKHNGNLIRVSQNCDGEYGKAITFSQMNKNFWESFDEEQICYIGVGDVRLNRPLDYVGIHTYTATEHFEVIDLKGYHYSIIVTLGRIFHRLVDASMKIFQKNRR